MQVDIAKRVFSPADVRPRPRVIEAMGDGTGAVLSTGRWKTTPRSSNAVIVALPAIAAERAPGSPRSTTSRHQPDRRSVLYMPAAGKRPRKMQTIPAGTIIFDLGRRAPTSSLPGEGRRRCGQVCRRPGSIRCSGPTPSGACRRARGAAGRRRSCPEVDTVDAVGRSPRRAARRRRSHQPMIETPTAMFNVRHRRTCAAVS